MALNDEQLGVVAVTLALRFPNWQRRRLERLTFVDGNTLRHDVGVTFCWPEPEFFPDTARPAVGDVVYVPLELGLKEARLVYDCSAADGSPSPIVTAARTGQLTTAGMAVLIWGFCAAHAPGCLQLSSVVRQIDAIVRSPRAPATAVFTDLTSRNSTLGTILGIVDERPNALAGLLEELSENLLFLVPVRYDPSADVLIRFGYSDPPFWVPRNWVQLGATFGLVDMPVDIASQDHGPGGRQLLTRDKAKGLALGRSASYHLEVVAPPGVTLARARLYGTYVLPGTTKLRRRVLINAGGHSPIVDLHARRPTKRTLESSLPNGWLVTETPPAVFRTDEDERIRTAVDGRPSDVERSDSGDAELRFRVPATGALLSITVVSVLTAGLLQAIRVGLGHLDDTTAASLLLALPALSLGFLTQPGEHALATRLLGGVRVAGAVVGVCALVVAAVIATGFIEQPGAPSYVCSARVPTAARPAPRQRGADQRSHTRHVAARVVLAPVRCAPAKSGVEPSTVRSSVRSVVDVAVWAASAFAVLLLLGWARTMSAGALGRASERRVWS